MKLKEFILVLINEFDGQISSKTKLQKLCYFYSVIYNKEMGFLPHYYGPYSPLVENALDDLISIGLINEKKSHIGIAHDGFEIVRYDYSLSEESKEFIQDVIYPSFRGEIKKIKEFLTRIKNIGNWSYFELSIAAKAYFILKKEGKNLTADTIIEKAKEFNWQISEASLNKAKEILLRLKLISDKNEKQ